MNHGHRITKREYEQAIVSLHATPLITSERSAEEYVRRRELDLTIDHRLGVNFPTVRRDALWGIQQQLESKRLRLAARWLTSSIAQLVLERRMSGVAQFVLDEYAQVLSPEEMQAYFNEDRVPSD